MSHPLLALVCSPPGDSVDTARDTPDPRSRSIAALQGEAWPSLVSRVREGDAAAFEMIVREYFTPLARFAFGFLRSYDAAEDVAQGVLCRVWERRATWAPVSGVRAYLFAAARNAALNLRAHEIVVERSRATVREIFAEPPELAEEEGLESEAAVRGAFGRLRIATAALSERQRLGLHLRYEQGLTVAEVAHVLVISPRATERLLARALRTLREALRA